MFLGHADSNYCLTGSPSEDLCNMKHSFVDANGVEMMAVVSQCLSNS